MKNLNILSIILIALVLSNCENPRYINAGVIWSDDSHFSEDGDWYLAISDGCYSNCEGADIDVLDQFPITVNKKTTQKFALGQELKAISRLLSISTPMKMEPMMMVLTN